MQCYSVQGRKKKPVINCYLNYIKETEQSLEGTAAGLPLWYGLYITSFYFLCSPVI